jgi:hypothetical protein
MKYLLALPLTLLTATADAAPGGEIGTLQQGSYVCELPGDATGPAGRKVEAAGFTVVNASSYTTLQGRGTYLLTGNQVVMTSGPKRGERYLRLSPGFLRLADADGAASELRCVRRVVNNR